MLRAESLAALDAMRIGEHELNLTAQHPGLGPVTMRQLLSAWVVHDLGHVVQVSRTMARQLTAAVGPWTARAGNQLEETHLLAQLFRLDRRLSE